MDAPVNLVAEFVEAQNLAQGSSALAAYAGLLVELGYINSIWEIADYDFDRGGPGGTGNGVPDTGEMVLLQWILEDGTFDRTAFGGTSQQRVYADWSQNIAQAALDLPTVNEWLQRAVAGYMTLGTPGHVEFITGVALAQWGVTLDPADYVATPGLAPEDDADGDGAWNRLEWLSVVEEYVITDPDFDDAVTYAEWAMDPTLPAQVDIGLDLADGDGTNWDYSHLPQGTVTFYSAQDLPIEIRILDPPGREDVPVTLGQPVQIPLGAELLIKLAEGANPDWFHYWVAPGQMINGSTEKTERFRLMANAAIYPERRPTSSIALSPSPTGDNAYTWQWSGVGPYGHLITSGSSSGNNAVQVPEGAFLRVRASKVQDPPAGYNNAGQNKQVARGVKYRFDFDKYGVGYGSPALNPLIVEGVQPQFTFSAPYGMWNHSVSVADGGFVGIGNELDSSGHLDNGGAIGSVTYTKPNDGVGGQTYRIVAFPFRGYEFMTWGGNVSGVPGVRQISATPIAPDAISGQAEFGEMLTLSAEVVVDGGGYGTPAEAGHVTASPARKYYSLHGTTYVQLDASVHVGYYFTHWSGDGVAYPNAGLFGGDAPDLDNPMPLNNPNAPVTDDVIWIVMESDDSGGAKSAGTGGARGQLRELFAKVEAICNDDEGNGEWEDMHELIKNIRCAGSYPTGIVWQMSDNCGNTLTIECTGGCLYHKYNGQTIGICQFTAGGNALLIQWSKHSNAQVRRFYRIRHVTYEAFGGDNDGDGIYDGDYDGDGLVDFIFSETGIGTSVTCCKEVSPILLPENNEGLDCDRGFDVPECQRYCSDEWPPQ